MRKFRLGEGFREEPQIEEEGEEEADEEEEQDEEEVRNEITSLIEALEEQSEEEELAVEEDTCPSVAEYTDNCAYVRELGMSLDEEALELCNRHQLCYTCGAYHNMNAVICDRGFLNEADRLCRGDATCKDEAAGLFFFMLRDRVFTDIQSTGFACAAKCTFEFITGISGA
ncbi:hypothetical protein CAPTEDRAFT_223090 [Capitella teleta]|uniref:Uncharacterized protein n=1 Tax=Capitella teleta TaxID=283909 RepID=R7V7J8_CAPTE|nr:hypothetical protein CAPTEDRAFT_223090 [Capitella teleta]|eukprot:ELU11710.1 hypothetical protein CAPTEDRAFT_223090 [Capitella teleta]